VPVVPIGGGQERGTRVTVVQLPAASGAPAAAAPEPPPQPRQLAARHSTADRVFVSAARATGFFVLAIVSAIGIFLGYQVVPTLRAYGWSFFTSQTWQPNRNVIGIGAAAVGTVQVAAIALVIAFPLAFFTSLYISDWAPPGLRPLLIRLVDLMAAIPSIVFGLWGLMLIQPHAAHVAHWFSKYLGWLPVFHVRTDVNYPAWNQLPGFTAYQGSAAMAAIAVSMMVFPMATSVMREVFALAPAGEKEAALALGGTRWSVARTVVIPFGRSGIIGGTMLALGRALGETISVVLILQPAYEIKWNVLEGGNQTISALIAGSYAEATPTQLSALLAAGFVLFLMTLVVNTIAGAIVARGRRAAGAEL
jgi:phosphate transport system permease protein